MGRLLQFFFLQPAIDRGNAASKEPRRQLNSERIKSDAICYLALRDDDEEDPVETDEEQSFFEDRILQDKEKAELSGIGPRQRSICKGRRNPTSCSVIYRKWVRFLQPIERYRKYLGKPARNQRVFNKGWWPTCWKRFACVRTVA